MDEKQEQNHATACGLCGSCEFPHTDISNCIRYFRSRLDNLFDMVVDKHRKVASDQSTHQFEGDRIWLRGDAIACCVLNLFERGVGMTVQEICDRLKGPHISYSVDGMVPLLNRFRAVGWVNSDDTFYVLTPEGRVAQDELRATDTRFVKRKDSAVLTERRKVCDFLLEAASHHFIDSPGYVALAHAISQIEKGLHDKESK